MTSTTPPAAQRELDDPVIDASNDVYWKACAEGRLTARRCTACRKLHWYPRPQCPFCMGDTAWEDLGGRGRIYSVSVTRRAGPAVYAIAYVELDEGITVLSNIVDCDLDALRIGDRVRVVFKATPDGSQLLVFTPDR